MLRKNLSTGCLSSAGVFSVSCCLHQEQVRRAYSISALKTERWQQCLIRKAPIDGMAVLAWKLPKTSSYLRVDTFSQGTNTMYLNEGSQWSTMHVGLEAVFYGLKSMSLVDWKATKMVVIEGENHGKAEPILEKLPHCFRRVPNNLPRHPIHSSQNKQYDWAHSYSTQS